MAAAKRATPYRLTPPQVPEHGLQKQIADILRLEIGPPGKLSTHKVIWWSVDHANYAGEVPGIRVRRGIISGVPDTFICWLGRAFKIELKSKADTATLSGAQQAVISALLEQGTPVAIVDDADDFLRVLDYWGIPRNHRVAVAA